MAWLLGFAGAVFGALMASGEPIGWVFGALLGVLFARSRAQSAELAELQRRLHGLELAGVSERARASLQARAHSPSPPSVEPTPAAPATAPTADLGATPPAQEEVLVSPAAPATDLPPMQAAAVAMHEPAPTKAAMPQPDPWGAPAPVGMDSGPGLVERAFAAARRWLSEGNVPVKIGMLVLFAGVAALLKYAAEQGMFSLPIELRLAAVAAAGVGALAFAWRQREARRMFSLSLQGGAIGVLLLTVFAAFRMYSVLPAGAALSLVVVLVAGCGALAVLQNALALAVLGSVGGFLAPVLISTSSGNHVALFGYYAALNAAIFAIAWVRPWRVLNLVGFVFTFAIGSMWGWRYYQPQHFATTEPFLLLFFLFYVAIAILYALRQPGSRHGMVDGTLVFGTPLLAFGLQTAMLDDDAMALAWSALTMAVLYAALAWGLRKRAGLQTMIRAFAALALGFATLSVPLALDADLTASVWALEGVGVLWLGLRQQRRSQIVAGLALQSIALIAWLVALLGASPEYAAALRNAVFLAGVLLAFALGSSAWLLDQVDGGSRSSAAMAGIAGVVWLVTGLHEIDSYTPAGEERAATVLWLAVAMGLAGLLRWRLPWPRAGYWSVLAIVGTLPLAVSFWGERWTEGWASWAWPLWLLSALFALASLRDPIGRGVSWAHAATLACVAWLLGNEAYVRVIDHSGSETAWAMVAVIVPLWLLLLATSRQPARAVFPLGGLYPRYRLRWLLPAGAALLVWVALSLFHDGTPAPLAYLPLLNPLELGQLAAMLLIYGLLRSDSASDDSLRVFAVLAGFVWISVVTARSVHHLAEVPWDGLLWQSMLVQTSLTVVWSVLGVGAWIAGSRRASWPTWAAGAVLMAIVLAKLVLVDRQHMGNIAGIVSFLAVGVLLTVVGYLAPSPPRKTA